jgi:hypothetical protein
LADSSRRSSSHCPAKFSTSARALIGGAEQFLVGHAGPQKVRQARG